MRFSLGIEVIAFIGLASCSPALKQKETFFDDPFLMAPQAQGRTWMALRDYPSYTLLNPQAHTNGRQVCDGLYSEAEPIFDWLIQRQNIIISQLLNKTKEEAYDISYWLRNVSPKESVYTLAFRVSLAIFNQFGKLQYGIENKIREFFYSVQPVVENDNEASMTAKDCLDFATNKYILKQNQLFGNYRSLINSTIAEKQI